MAYTFKHGDRPLDGYTIQRAVGRGGFGEVYYAISDGGREVALKYLRDNPQVELRGVSNCINLKSPHLVSIFDVKQTTEGEYIIIMEYCSGPSLRDLLIAEPSGFAPEKAAFFARELGKGLSYLHDRGIVHRDLKPGNIFYDDGYVKIGDYGLSKFISVSRHSAQTASVGTVHYMAPEIGSGDYSRGVDIYALGVMLYEMIRGRVPFEGSTMAEILMKHLTSQPEVDHLPEPFGRVIRKALEKDPRNRYATVDEMLDELLGVEAIQKSLAGFSVRSLDGAVARAGGGGDPSPVPSPNPTPPFGGPHGVPGDAPPLPDRLARRLDRVQARVDRKLARLARRSRPAKRGVDPTVARMTAAPTTDRWKRILLSALMVAGLAVALGIVSGVNIRAEAGASAGMLVVLMSIAVGLAAKAVPWFGAAHGPRWAQFMIRTGCAAPLLAIGAAPIMASRHSEHGLGLWVGLLVVAVFGNWTRAFEHARDGEVRLGCAIWTGFGALMASAMAMGMMDVEPRPYMFIAAGVAASVSLIVQASNWWSLGGAVATAESPPTTRDAGDDPGGSVQHGRRRWHRNRGWAFARARSRRNRRRAFDSSTDEGPPFAQPFGDPRARRMFTTMQATMRAARAGANQAGEEAGAYDPHIRWALTRSFWSVVSFLLMGGAIITFLLTLILDDLSYDDRTGTILGCIACAALFTVAVRKTTPVKREGFWRETGRPFFLGVTMFGIGGTITGIARYWNGMPTDEHVLVIIGLVASSMWFLFLLVARCRRRTERPFVRGSSSEALRTDETAASGDETDRDDGGGDDDSFPAPARPV